MLDICIFPLNNCNLQWVEYTNAHPTGKARGLCLRDRVKDTCRHLLKAPSCGGSSQVIGGPQATNSSESKFVSPPSLPGDRERNQLWLSFTEGSVPGTARGSYCPLRWTPLKPASRGTLTQEMPRGLQNACQPESGERAFLGNWVVDQMVSR